jgi:hypothetical protein
VKADTGPVEPRTSFSPAGVTREFLQSVENEPRAFRPNSRAMRCVRSLVYALGLARGSRPTPAANFVHEPLGLCHGLC